MTTGYIHIRPGQTYTPEEGLKGTPSPKGGVTVAYQVTDGVADYGYAICSPRDSYNRKLGRDIAVGRLLKWTVTCGAVAVEEDRSPASTIVNWLHETGTLK